MDSDADFSAILPWFLEMIPFNVQTKNRNRVGGVMTPPYENIPSNYNLTFDKRKTTSPLLARWGCCLQKGLERREVEKRIYGVERLRLTASASFLVIEYPTVLNMD